MTTIQFHILQSLPPNLINRDENGRPKTAQFGGYLRARVSSQAWKAAIRKHPTWNDMPRSVRSRGHVALLADELKSQSDNEAKRLAVAAIVIEACFGKLSDNRDSLQTNTFLAPDEIKLLADQAITYWPELADAVPDPKGEDESDKAYTRRVATAKKAGETVGKKIRSLMEKTFANRSTAYDLALFGRMLASAPTMSIDAALNVNHAISVNRIAVESDFFTGMDDIPVETGQLQASMLDFTDYTSGAFYRYLVVNFDQLVYNLTGDVDYAKQVLKHFMIAMTRAIPSGKNTAFGDSRSLPDLLLAEVRRDNFAYSLANAFEAPIQTRGSQGLLTPAATALEAYWLDQRNMWETSANHTVLLKSSRISDEALPTLAEKKVQSFTEWSESVIAALEV